MMKRHKLKVLLILIYKNTLVRLRQWKITLFVELLIPILLLLAIWGMRNAFAKPPTIITENTTYDMVPEGGDIPFFEPILVAPDNNFTRSLTDHLGNCLRIDDSEFFKFFTTEEDMLLYRKNISKDYYLRNHDSSFDHIKLSDFGLVIQNTGSQLGYKILTSKNLPKSQYSNLMSDEGVFEGHIVQAQICIDKSLIKLKSNDPNLNIEIDIQEMPDPPHVEAGLGDRIFRPIFSVFVVVVFLIPLCIETSYASSEKFSGINVLMSMNGVPNYLNLLSWLISGLTFSTLYTVPIDIIVQNTSNDYSIPIVHYGNSFIFWLILTFNAAHFLAFGMHISAYFTRSLFMVTGIIVIYVGTTAIQQYGIKEDAFILVPYLGIFFPNMLLLRALEEVNYYESTEQGFHWSNIFYIGDRNYGTGGSIGMMLVFSIIGTIFHFALANYIYAINPGKYGVKQSPFYFFKFLRRGQKPYAKVEDNESTGINTSLFEKVPDNVHTSGIKIRNLKKIYKIGLFHKTNVYAVRGISGDFIQGQITALLGHNGAGKTTMMSMLTGMTSPTEGSVFINGKNIKDDLEEVLNDMGLCPQENMLFPHLSVNEQLTFFALLKNKNKTRQEILNDVTELVGKLNLANKRTALPKQLSGGQKRRLSLGLALIGDPSVLVLDEPTSGLDPESKRNIWDELLRVRENKTILISTHDMEEADILGDKIAIMHTGQLKSCGSVMFLKKLIGEGNLEITLSTNSDRDPEEIRNYFDSQTQISSVDDDKVVLSTPLNQNLPDFLDKVEAKKVELGITGMSVSMITLEKVFLKVTKDNDEFPETQEPFISSLQKLEGQKLLFHSLKALLLKKLTYTMKNLSAPLIIISLLAISLACISFMLMEHSSSPDPIQINADMYSKVKAYYSTDSISKEYGRTYTAAAEENHIQTVDFSKNNDSFEDALLYSGSKQYNDYLYHNFIGAEFEKNVEKNFERANVWYKSKKALFALPISTNLVSNTLLKTLLGKHHSIRMSVQEFPIEEDPLIHNIEILSWIQGFAIPIILLFFLYPAVALFIIHPIKESLSGVKHLQKMAGVSCFSYWGTMFIFDFLVFFGISVLFVVAFVILDTSHQTRLFSSTEAFIMLLLFTLFAINILPLLYVFSFWKRPASAAIRLLSLLPLGIILVEFLVSAAAVIGDSETYSNTTWYQCRLIQKRIFMLTPYVSFFHGNIVLFKNSKINAGCKLLAKSENKTGNFSMPCQDMKCIDGICTNAVNYFGDSSKDVALETSVFYMSLTPFLYFAILYLIDYKVVPKLIARIRNNKPDTNENFLDEQVKVEKDYLSLQSVRIENRNNTSTNDGVPDENSMENGRNLTLPNNETNKYRFFVFELRKLYGKLEAVQNISFGVKERECFGLLGINGSGKSTTFKMMTGEEVPNYGLIYLDGKRLKDDHSSLSQIGYCPQTDAIINSLNAYEHLRLFARLRGIPEHKVEDEVEAWIKRLNLKACAVQPSGTYSGGNKRRLNIAMALIGSPSLVLMDEPTTGVDPAARRSLWSVIQACQANGLAVILTSHSMEECEALCNRLTIMVNGKLVCLGAPQELKQRFGAGYDIQLKLNIERSREQIDNIKDDIINSLNCEVVDENSGYLMFHVPSNQITWRRMYDAINEVKSTYTSIEDYSIISSTLEQLFLLFARSAGNSNFRTNSL